MITKVDKIESESGMIKLLTPTDCVKDRLAAYFHWDDRQSLDQAVMVSKSQKIDMKNIEKWAHKEGNDEKLKKFKQELEKQ